MIIVSNKPGQLGNLLFVYANLLAYGLEHNIKIFNPSFYQYQAYFASTQKRSRLVSKIMYKIVFVIARVLDKLHIRIQPFVYIKALDWKESLNLDMYQKELACNFCFLQGWLYRGNHLMIKHKAYIKKYFTPTLKLKEKIDNFFDSNFDLSNELIITIHIRRGDYKYFENGKYYYSMNEYKRIIYDTYEIFKNQKPHFLICSNESIDIIELFSNQYKVTLAPNHELLDMYCMVRSHYIVGPPSTYSMWASYYGNVPLCMIHDKNKKVELKDFNVELDNL